MISRISILIFPNVEVLDFCGPLEVFSVARRFWPGLPPEIELVGPTTQAIQTIGGMPVLPHRRLEDCLHTDVLVIPGGRGTRALLADTALQSWIKGHHARARVTLSICSGALLLAQAGLLKGLRVTTHHQASDELQQLEPTACLNLQARFVDNGSLITAAGISAGIDAALYTVARLTTPAVASATADYMEYDWRHRDLYSA